MTFYNVVSAVLFLGAFQQLLLAAESSHVPRIIMASTLALLVFNDAVFTSHTVEGARQVNYRLSMMLIDLLNFLLLAVAIVVINPLQNPFSVAVVQLGPWLNEPCFWMLVAAYWLLVLLWSRLAGWYGPSYPRWLLVCAFLISILFFLEALVANGGDSTLNSAGRWIAGGYLALYILVVRPLGLRRKTAVPRPTTQPPGEGTTDSGQDRISILGWGSLLWEGGHDFDNWHDIWNPDGPQLKLEFSRISERRLGALTLVIDPKNGTPIEVSWCLSKRKKIEDAVADLRCREGTTNEKISWIRIPRLTTSHDKPPEKEDPIVVWARQKNLDAVIWTALQSNFEQKAGKMFSPQAAAAYLQGLRAEAKAKAAEYVWRAPAFVRTPLRDYLERESWFAKRDSP